MKRLGSVLILLLIILLLTWAAPTLAQGSRDPVIDTLDVVVGVDNYISYQIDLLRSGEGDAVAFSAMLSTLHTVIIRDILPAAETPDQTQLLVAFYLRLVTLQMFADDVTSTELLVLANAAAVNLSMTVGRLTVQYDYDLEKAKTIWITELFGPDPRRTPAPDNTEEPA